MSIFHRELSEERIRWIAAEVRAFAEKDDRGDEETIWIERLSVVADSAGVRLFAPDLAEQANRPERAGVERRRMVMIQGS